MSKNDRIKLKQDNAFKISFKMYRAVKALEILKNWPVVDPFLSVGLGEGMPLEMVFGQLASEVCKRDYDEIEKILRHNQRNIEIEREFFDMANVVILCGIGLTTKEDVIVLEPIQPLNEFFMTYNSSCPDKILESVQLPRPLHGLVAADCHQIKLWELHENFTLNPTNIVLSHHSRLKGKMLPANLFSRTKGELCNVVAGVKEGSEWITNLLERSVQMHGIHQIEEASDTSLELLVKRQSKVFSNTKFLRELKTLESYFQEERDGITTRGRRATTVAIKRRVTKVLLVSEDNDLVVEVTRNQGDRLIAIRRADDEEHQHEAGNLRRIPLLLWLHRNVSSVKGEVVLVSGHSSMGRRLDEECQGIGAILECNQFITSSDEE